jgi:hypothetical protein
MERIVLPRFADIFPTENAPNRSDLLAGIPSECLITLCAYINAQLYWGGNSYPKEVDMFKLMIGREPDDALRNLHWKNFQEWERKAGNSKKGIFPLPNVLQLIQESMLAYVPGVPQKLTPDQEIGILKALLLMNTESDERMVKIVQAIEQGKKDGMYPLLWSSLMPHSSFFLTKDFLICMYKSFHFYKYLEVNFKEYLDNYLKLNNVDAFQKIVLEISMLYFNGYNKEKDSFTSFFPPGLIKNNTVVELMSMDVVKLDKDKFIAGDQDKNFKGLRTHPVLKLKSGKLTISNWKFIIDKYYDGLVFDFFNRSGIQTNEKFKTFGAFKTAIGKDFSNNFFMEVMKEIFAGHGNIAYKEGERNADCDYDFYLRIENHVFFFEFKDILFPIKETYDEIKAVVDEKLAGKQGAMQLKRHIERLATTPNTFDDFGGYTLDQLIIHPILVYCDSSFGMTGINRYLADILAAEIQPAVKEKFEDIKGLALMHWDFILEHHDSFKNREFALSDVMRHYHVHLDQRFEALRKNPSTENYIATYDGFDSIISSVYPTVPGKKVNGTIFNFIMNEVKPFLLDTKKPSEK